MENQAYISHVHLKGYKSIRDMSVDLLPGLNIIIGPNGSGKTNFLEFLNAALSGNHRLFESDSIEAKINFELKGHKNQYELKGYFSEFNESDDIELRFIVDEKILSDKKIIFSNKKIKGVPSSPSDLSRMSHIMMMTRLTFDNQLESLFTKPIRLSFREQPVLNRYIMQASFFINFFNRFMRSFIDMKALNKENSLDFIKDNIFNKENTNDFIEILKKYTPIKDIEINQKSITINKDLDKARINIDNIFIQFKVNGDWFFWNQLSDGTKRLFYIFCGVFFENRTITDFSIGIEEPELGIHPDQLYKLMDFLKEQSKEKQIIITTHSPEVLNILGKDELDRIIITRYDDEKGTQMHHLSPKQIRKGQIYIEEVGNLKSFWVHSNLEEYEAE